MIKITIETDSQIVSVEDKELIGDEDLEEFCKIFANALLGYSFPQKLVKKMFSCEVGI